jgi:MFS family permease
LDQIKKRQILGAYLGNFFEHYDTALFGFLSPFLAPLLYPKQQMIYALIMTYAMIPLGMIARPFGAYFFGVIGDTEGREKALYLSLMGMALATGALAFCPTYAQAGILAPLLFAIGKCLQGFCAAGETVGGAIFVLENSSDKTQDFKSSLFNASTMGGMIVAGGAVALISRFFSVEHDWRWLYGLGCLTALFGTLLRKGTIFSKKVDVKKSWSFFLKDFWLYKNQILAITFMSGLGHATYAISLVLMNGLVPLITPFSKSDMAELNLYLLVLDFATLPFFGWVSQKVGREKLMFFASGLIVVLSGPLFCFMETTSFALIVLIRSLFVLLGVAFFAPFFAYSFSLIPKNCRYLIVSLSYAMGSQIFGAPTAAISLFLYHQTGMIFSASWYLALLGLMCFISIYSLGAKRSERLEA